MEKRKYVEVKFSDSKYVKTYQYGVPPHLANVVKVGNRVVVPNGLDPNATGSDEYRIAVVTAVCVNLPPSEIRSTKDIVDVIDDEYYQNIKEYRKQIAARNKMLRAIQDYIQEYGGEAFVDNIEWRVAADSRMTLNYQIHITESNSVTSSSNEDLLYTWSGKNIY